MAACDVSSTVFNEVHSLHFILFPQQSRIQTLCVHYATYNSLGGRSKARSALTTAPSNEKKRKKELVRIKYNKKQSDNTDESILKRSPYAVRGIHPIKVFIKSLSCAVNWFSLQCTEFCHCRHIHLQYLHSLIYSRSFVNVYSASQLQSYVLVASAAVVQ